jgi:hypothetical protein
MASLAHDVEVKDGDLPSHEKDQEIRIERSESLDGLPDPDAGKTDEERKKIVCFSPRPPFCPRYH